MNKYIFAALLSAATVLGTTAALAEEGDYIVILKEAPAIMLFDESNGVIDHVDNVFLVDSLMSAYSLSPASNVEAIFPDEIAYLSDYEENGELSADAPVVENFPEGADDLYYADQWHIPYINANAAWRRNFSGSGVRIGIIDSGMDMTHPDLPRPTLYYNAMSGADTSDISDELGHGTSVTGIIASKTNNGLYTSGIAYGADIVSIKVASKTEFYTSSMLLGFKKAVEYDCDVINMSLGFTKESAPATTESMRGIVKKAIDEGVIIVAAAGNFGSTEEGSYYHYPASYDNVLSVGSLGDYSNHTGVNMEFTKLSVPMRNANGTYSYSTILSNVPSSFTQHNDKVTCAAPGYRIMTTAPGSTTARKSGTSFASPIVASAAAIAKQMYPEITAPEFIEAVKATSTDVFTDGYDIYTGYGAINMEALLDYIEEEYLGGMSTPEPSPPPEETTTPEPTETPEPTATPTPTPEPTPTPSPTPEPDGIIKNGNSYVVRVSYEELPSDARVLAAIYKDGKLTAVKSTYVMSGSKNTKIRFTYDSEIDYTMIFVWNFEENDELRLIPLRDKMRVEVLEE